MQGSMNPATDLTDADGITASRWTTKVLYTEQEAYASLKPVPGPRVPGSILPGMIQFTAIATPAGPLRLQPTHAASRYGMSLVSPSLGPAQRAVKAHGG
jgi:hypothetical protein